RAVRGPNGRQRRGVRRRGQPAGDRALDRLLHVPRGGRGRPRHRHLPQGVPVVRPGGTAVPDRRGLPGRAHPPTRPLADRGPAPRARAGPADERGELAAGFNTMAGQLETNMRVVNEREAHIRAIMDTAADGIVTLDERGKIESLNVAAVRMFGHRRDELIGHNVSMLLAEGRKWTLADIESR